MAISYNSNYDGTTPMSDICFQLCCNQNVVLSITIPGNANQKFQAEMNYNQTSNVFVRLNANPAIPSLGTSGSQQYNSFRKKKTYVRGGDTLRFITSDTNAYVGVSVMQIQA